MVKNSGEKMIKCDLTVTKFKQLFISLMYILAKQNQNT